MHDSANAAGMPAEPGAVRGSLSYPIVGIGASAGGLGALLQLLEQMPDEPDMAFLVILQAAPEHPGSPAEILQRATRMPVVEVTARVQLAPGHVYVIGANQQMSMMDGLLLVDERERQRGRHTAIDLFFRTLADVHRERSIAIVLSGNGADGAVGLARIKEQGGVTLAQAPGDAEHTGMPIAAILTGVVDFVLPVVEMPHKLMELWSNARAIELPPADDDEQPVAQVAEQADTSAAERALQEIIVNLLKHTGHDFRHYKRATVLRRIERRLQVRRVRTLPAYRDLLATDATEHKALLGDMLIGVTNFFRDREAFDALKREIVPELFSDKGRGDEIRAWVAACATGEEAYSIAMLLADHAALSDRPPGFQVFASDIDERAIASARAGSYPAAIIADVAPSRLRQYFNKEDNRYRVRKTLRDHILFAAHNLLRDPPFSRLDLISCRNLLIYLNREARLHVLKTFHFALRPGGYLFLGSSESAESVAEYFIPVDKKNRIYRARGGIRTLQYQPPHHALAGPRLAETARDQPSGKRQVSYAELHQRALAQFAPPSAIVDNDGNIVHMSAQAGQFLRMGVGEPSNNVLNLVLPELRLELRSAIYQATQNAASVECRPIALLEKQEFGTVAMTVRPFRDEDAETDFLLLLFNRVEQAPARSTPLLPNGSQDVVLAQLEAELQKKREQLQETIENAEISTEELRASNEELQAINEELRSATEELETSKEELQSVNEELITVNYELKAKVEETGKANDDLNNLIASTDIATIFVDSGLRIKRFTPRAADLFSIIASDIGRSLLDLTHRLDYDRLAEDVGATFDTLRLVEREVRSSDDRYYIVRLLPYRTNDDRIEGAVMTFFDITARRGAEEQARASEARMQMVAESADDYAIVTLDGGGRVTSWNRGAEYLFGYKAADMLGHAIERLFVPEDRAAGVPAGELRRARSDGRAEDERWHLRKDGSRVFCSGVTTPLHNGNCHGYVKIARDATRRERQGLEREQASHEREATARSDARNEAALKDEFLSIMSHELRHPLNMININVELLARMPEIRTSPLFMRAAAIIRNAVLSQAKIIDDLMDMSRVRTGKLSLSMAPLALGPVVAGIVEAERADPAAREIAIEVADEAGGLYVLADVVRIEQVVMNLLSNAVKFTPAGGRIDVRLRGEDGQVRVDVCDSGQGIAPDFLPHVFDMFGQSMAVTTRTMGGLGIGLALVREIVALQGGRVEAHSEGVGKGARFTFWLPQLDSAAALQGGPHTDVRDSMAGIRILVVDGMEEMLMTFKALLETSGATVFEATSAQRGLDILERETVDLLISDMSMLGMDGDEFLRRIRANPKLAGLPAIAVTGLQREHDIARARAAGFSAQLGKPVSIDHLHAIVHELLPRRHEATGED
ncbi:MULTISPECIES: CheR family methyltransferase [unclassified Massilia]|uniref:CheR family methyltransferase n=1 Tax=unclassified Massilia TaxID=2609279 RepID=UPI00178745F1|nr:MULTISPECIES: CheR family methyltransferase [unclassified Massilia]MBD8530726.1 PAS domain-containing protein [Massilia sp. CFBP 13647]MBD8676452.1 PAS domain-containing protein [Massilia sp. CFBP 13721]